MKDEEEEKKLKWFQLVSCCAADWTNMCCSQEIWLIVVNCRWFKPTSPWFILFKCWRSLRKTHTYTMKNDQHAIKKRSNFEKCVPQIQKKVSSLYAYENQAVYLICGVWFMCCLSFISLQSCWVFFGIRMTIEMI